MNCRDGNLGNKASQLVKMDLVDRSVILHKYKESSEKERKSGFEHELSHMQFLISKLLPVTVVGVSIYKLCRMGEKVSSGSTQKNRLLKVTLVSAEERNLILQNARKLTGSGIHVGDGLSLVGRVNRQSAEVEINERLQRGEKTFYLRVDDFLLSKLKSSCNGSNLNALSTSWGNLVVGRSISFGCKLLETTIALALFQY